MGASDAKAVQALRNRLLAALTPDDYRLLQSRLEPVALQSGTTLSEPNRPIEHAYFLEDGLASLIAEAGGLNRLEVALIGPEGVVGIPVLLGLNRSPSRAFVTVGGAALRIRHADMRAALRQSWSLQTVMLRYVQAAMNELSHLALVVGRFSLERRLARWLLMAHDRLLAEDIPVTHQLLSTILGVRRPGVTVALHTLESSGAIRSKRGMVSILDRASLEETAGSAYQQTESAPGLWARAEIRHEQPLLRG